MQFIYTNLVKLLFLTVLLLSSCRSYDKDPRELYSSLFHSASVTSVKFSVDGNLLATSGKDRLIRVLDVSSLKDSLNTNNKIFISEKIYSPFVSTGQGFDCLDFSPNGQEIAACDFEYLWGGIIRQYDLASENGLFNSISISDSYINALSYHPENETIVVGEGKENYFGRIAIASLVDNSVFHPIENTFNGFSHVEYSVSGKELLAVSKYKSILLLKEDDTVYTILSDKNYLPTKAVFIPNSDLIISSGEEIISLTNSYRGLLSVWNNIGDLLQKRVVSKLPIRALTVSSDGRVLACAGDDLIIRIVKVDTLEIVGEIIGHTDPINDLDFSVDDRFLVSGGDDGYVFIWNVSDLFTQLDLEDAGDNKEYSSEIEDASVSDKE